MNRLEGPWSTEDLLGHTAWMKSLARGLLSDAERAEEVVQDTWLEFFRRPPRDRGAAVSWLHRVVRNLALTSRTARARRAARERLAAKPEIHTSTPSQMLEQAEMHRLLVDEVLRMEEPYRSTVLSRFFAEQTPAEIAQGQGVPLDTVKTSLRRAIEQLRERLDRVQGGRESWMAALVPLAGGPPAQTAGASAAGASAASSGGGSASGVALSSTTLSAKILGGLIVTQKALVSACIVGALALAVGYGIGKVGSPAGGEETNARERAEASRLQSSEASLKALHQEVEKARLAAAAMSNENVMLAAKVKNLGEELEVPHVVEPAGQQG